MAMIATRMIATRKRLFLCLLVTTLSLIVCEWAAAFVVVVPSPLSERTFCDVPTAAPIRSSCRSAPYVGVGGPRRRPTLSSPTTIRLAALYPQHLSAFESTSPSLLVSDFVDIATTVAFWVLGFFTFMFVLTLVSVNWLIPQAARELEEKTKSQYPELWAEYEAKLEPGETMAQRPDLIQELGNEYRARLAREFEQQLQKRFEQQGSESESAFASSSSDTSSGGTSNPFTPIKTVIDVEVEREGDDKKEE